MSMSKEVHRDKNQLYMLTTVHSPFCKDASNSIAHVSLNVEANASSEDINPPTSSGPMA